MSLGLFSSSSSRKRHHLMGSAIEDQLSDLRSDIASLANLVSKRGSKAGNLLSSRASDVRGQAETGLADMVDGAEQLLSDLRHRYASTERQVRHTVREHPLATVGAIAALGIAFIALSRR
ncbi:hypothetical protein ASG25_16460 [Rhizobium sp. Leaf384]|uniref:hypothetical protein n=1 Tax=unclassified Rhizobium TaxID=2613769 RepID=UPI0007160754|nr:MULTISPECIES: hypothetical protein [unclassified Rhizobium]KQS76982.1 hypothetical protein ASG25_16460 [Rhizobium sp. Leaf384]KQS78253.1 hypothetical protein ASG58_07675 [Rhizobium sp. Leaf383]